MMNSSTLDFSSSDEDYNVDSQHGPGPTPTSQTAITLKEISCANKSCHQEIIKVNGMDLYCSRDCYNKKVDRGRVPESKVLMKRTTIIGRGGTGLLADHHALDHLVITADEKFGRIVTTAGGFRKSSGITERSKDQRAEDKRKLKELLNLGGDSDDDTSSEDESSQDGSRSDQPVNAKEEIRTTFTAGNKSIVCPLHPSLSSGIAYVINVKSPWEMYIQTLGMIKRTHEIDTLLNCQGGIDNRLMVKDWSPEVGKYCCAKYEGKFYRAKILNKEKKNHFRVKYVDYGNDSIVHQTDVRQLNPETTLTSRQCVLFQISNAKPLQRQDKWSPEACQFAMDHLDGAEVKMAIENVEIGIVHVGKLHVESSISGEIKGDFGEALVDKCFAEPDIYFK